MLAPTASGGDGAGPRFCAPLPTSPPRFRGIALKTLDEFPSTASFFFFCVCLFAAEKKKAKAEGRMCHAKTMMNTKAE